MTRESDRLKALARRVSEVPVSENRNSEKRLNVSTDVHPAHGEKGDFLKVTATLSPEVYELVVNEMKRRKLARQPNAQMSAILREAVIMYLGKPSQD